MPHSERRSRRKSLTVLLIVARSKPVRRRAGWMQSIADSSLRRERCKSYNARCTGACGAVCVAGSGSDGSKRFGEERRVGALQANGVGENPTKETSAAFAVVETEHMACNPAKRSALHDRALRVRNQRFDHVRARFHIACLAEKARIDASEDPRIVIRGAPDHHPVDVRKLARSEERRVGKECRSR